MLRCESQFSHLRRPRLNTLNLPVWWWVGGGKLKRQGIFIPNAQPTVVFGFNIDDHIKYDRLLYARYNGCLLSTYFISILASLLLTLCAMMTGLRRSRTRGTAIMSIHTSVRYQKGVGFRS